MTTATAGKNGYIKLARRIEKVAEKKTGLDLEELFAAGTIAASLALYIFGRKSLALIIGLTPVILAARAKS